MSRNNTHFMYVRAEIPQIVHTVHGKHVARTRHRVGAIAFGFKNEKVYVSTSIAHPEDRKSAYCKMSAVRATESVTRKIARKGTADFPKTVSFNLEKNWLETARATVKLLNISKIVRNKWLVDTDTLVGKLAEAMRIQYETVTNPK